MVALRMKIGLDLERLFFCAPDDGNRNSVARGDEERRVDHIFRLVHLRLADLQQNVARLNAAAERGRVFYDLGQLGRGAFNWFLGGCDVDADPAVARFPEADEVVPDLFRGVNRQGVTGGTVFDLGDEDADDFALEVLNAVDHVQPQPAAEVRR